MIARVSSYTKSPQPLSCGLFAQGATAKSVNRINQVELILAWYLKKYYNACLGYGSVAERLNAAVLKTAEGESPP